MAFRLLTEGLTFIAAAISLISSGSRCDGCGGNISGSGIIRSPNFPNEYPNLCNCTWTFQAAAEHAEIVLQLSKIFTEEGHDFLRISDARGMQLVFSGNHPVQNIILQTPATIRFTTDVSVVKQGFAIKFNNILLSQDCGCDGCGGTIYGSGIFQSPTFPNNYPNFCHSTWTIQSAAGPAEIVLQLRSIYTKNKYDFLRVSDDRGTQLSFSGNHPMQNIILQAPATIRFTSGVSSVRQGFVIKFSTILLSQGASLDNSTRRPPADSSTLAVIGNSTIIEDSTSRRKNVGNATSNDDSPEFSSNLEYVANLDANVRAMCDSYATRITASGLKDLPTSEKSALDCKQCTGVLAGATVGTVALTTVVIVIALIVRRRSQSKKSTAQVSATVERGDEAIAMEDNPVYE